jgi:hypothetical protein
LADVPVQVLAVDQREDLDGVNEMRTQVSLTSPTQASSLNSLKSHEQDIWEAARTRLENALSSEGATRLQKYIREDVKRHIVIYGSVPR